jgi:RNA polymerase sigma-70 factor (ECF subfamily)
LETELELLNAIRNGERGAQQRLYERYAGMAMAIGQRYAPDRDTAQDVVHDSFVKILTSVGKFRYQGEGSLRAWVISIVVHCAIDSIKDHDRLMLTDHLPERPDEKEEPDVGRVPPDVLTKLISKLPPGYRMVLNLYVFEQLSHKEIGQLLDITPQTSASQYSRAKHTLARLINNYLKNNKL